MSMVRLHALEALYKIKDRISREVFSSVFCGLAEIETLEERDRKIEAIWELFEDVPMNPETECIEKAFWCFPAGTDRYTIWHWFDDRHSKGVHYLLYELPRK